MPKVQTGRVRKTKRGARKRAETRLSNLLSGQDYYELQPHDDVRQIRKSVVRWNTDARWEDVSMEEVKEEIKKGKLSFRTIAMIVNRNLMVSEDERVAVAAVGNALRMEGQNQKDDETTRGSGQPSVVINNTNAQQNNLTLQDVVDRIAKDDPNYVRYLRQAAVDEDHESGALGTGNSKGVQDTEARAIHRRSGNGSPPGKNGSPDTDH